VNNNRSKPKGGENNHKGKVRRENLTGKGKRNETTKEKVGKSQEQKVRLEKGEKRKRLSGSKRGVRKKKERNTQEL